METSETLSDVSSSSTLYTHLYSGTILPNGGPGLLPPSHTLSISTKSPPSCGIKILQWCPKPSENKTRCLHQLFSYLDLLACAFLPLPHSSQLSSSLWLAAPILLPHLFHYLNIISIKSDMVHLFICLCCLASSPMKFNLHKSWAQSVLFVTLFSLSRTEPGTQAGTPYTGLNPRRPGEGAVLSPGGFRKSHSPKASAQGLSTATSPTLRRPLPAPRARGLGGCSFSPGPRGHVGKVGLVFVTGGTASGPFWPP